MTPSPAQPDPAAPGTGPDPGRLRVLAVIHNESISGPGRQLAALAAALRETTGMLVAILHRHGNPHPPYARFLEQLGVPYVLVDDHGPLDRAVVGRVRDVIRSFRPHVLQTHGYKATAIGWALRRTRHRLPWVGFFHGETTENAKARFYHWLDHRMLAAADRIVVMSALQLARFHRLGDTARIIYNAVLPETVTAGDDDAAAIRGRITHLPRPVLGVAGRLSPEKGVDVFLDACAQLQRDAHPFSAAIAGDGPDRGPLETRASELGLGNRVVFLGEIRNVASFYDAIDVFVIPSHSEGLPNVLLEALAADLPVVSTRVGAVPEVIRHPLAGIIVPPADPAALARGILDANALAHSGEAREARAATVAEFSLPVRVRRHLEMYAELAGTAVQ